MKIYISGALTGVPNIVELKSFYERLAEACSDLGHEAYVPHLNSDPQKHAGLSPQQVYEMDSHQVKIADLVIAYVGVPSLGVGAELEIDNYEGVPLILLYEDDGRPVSRMARGNPAVIRHVVFSGHDEALTLIKAALQELMHSGA